MSPQVTISETLGVTAGAALAQAIEAVHVERGRCRLALCGGSSPAPVMAWLAEHLRGEPLRHLWVTWVDERHLPWPDSDDWRALPEASNLRLAWEHWFRRLPEPPTMVAMARPGPLADAAQAYAREFTERLGGLDVALLGAGSDGHIASLFAGHPALEAEGVCVAVDDSPKPPPQRLSLTMPVLEDVAHAVLVARGAGKAPMLARAYGGDQSLPLGRYRPRGSWRWVVDSAAAAQLPVPSNGPQRPDEDRA